MFFSDRVRTIFHFLLIFYVFQSCLSSLNKFALFWNAFRYEYEKYASAKIIQFPIPLSFVLTEISPILIKFN